MMYLIGLLLCTFIGYLGLRLLIGQHITGLLRWFLGAALGFGIVSQITFYIHLTFNWHNPWAVIAASLITLGALIFYNLKIKNIDDAIHWNKEWRLLCLVAVIGFFVLLESLYYPMGGWDAWSCWNLKAKFIYLGQDQWKNMLEPQLWRSNTHYPLFLPCLNVWFWDFCGQAYPWVPMLNSALLTTLTAAVLLFGLHQLTGLTLLPSLLTAAVFLLPFNITLGASQYSDIAFSLFILCAFVIQLLLPNKSESLPRRQQYMNAFLMAAFIGFLSFTKVEGLVAAVIFTCLMLWQKNKTFVFFICLTALPTLIFNTFMAPKNEAFINGLLSPAHPSTLERLETIILFTLGEFLSFKWTGLWLLLGAGILINWKSAWKSCLMPIGIFLVLYLSIVLTYYQVNTFFEINWWLTNTLNRILFSLLPLTALWLGLALKPR